MKALSSWVIVIAAAPVLMTNAVADDIGNVRAERQFTYSWQFVADDAMRPRGGTTKGPSVQLDRSPNAAWQRRRAGHLSAKR